jgi:formylmethanofuran dehydrogenase subunit B
VKAKNATYIMRLMPRDLSRYEYFRGAARQNSINRRVGQYRRTSGTNIAEQIDVVSTIQDASLKCCKSDAIHGN